MTDTLMNEHTNQWRLDEAWQEGWAAAQLMLLSQRMQGLPADAARSFDHWAYMCGRDAAHAARLVGR